MFLRELYSSRRSILLLGLGFLFGNMFHSYFNEFINNFWYDLPSIPMIPYPEEPWRQPNTLAVRTVASTQFARFEIHRVDVGNGKIIDDWLWEDERSHVNIVVHLKDENKYLIMKQKKYGFKGSKLAVVGGLFNINDTPEKCANRELLEETGLEAERMINLGAYRVQANRGGGILHAFYAKNCFKSKHNADKFEADYEAQEIKLVDLQQLKTHLLSGEFGEAQHVGAVGLAILHHEKEEAGNK